MSKVVHLSRPAHERAKQFCLHHGLSMSDWVAGLIERATSQHPLPPPKESSSRVHSQRVSSVPREHSPVAVQARDGLQAKATSAPRDEESELAQMYTAPPFWARERQASAASSDHA